MAATTFFFFPNPSWLPVRLGIQRSLFAVTDESGSICPVNLSKATVHLPSAPLPLPPSWASQRSGDTPSSALPQGLGTSCSCTSFRSPELSPPQCDPDRHVYLKCQPTLTHRPLTHHTVSLWDLRSAFLLLQALPADRGPRCVHLLIVSGLPGMRVPRESGDSCVLFTVTALRSGREYMLSKHFPVSK